MSLNYPLFSSVPPLPATPLLVFQRSLTGKCYLILIGMTLIFSDVETVLQIFAGRFASLW